MMNVNMPRRTPKRQRHLECPRCGLPKLNRRDALNAVSRKVDVMICSDCGIAEAHGGLDEPWAKPSKLARGIALAVAYKMEKMR
jgi:hypothetical protein